MRKGPAPTRQKPRPALWPTQQQRTPHQPRSQRACSLADVHSLLSARPSQPFAARAGRCAFISKSTNHQAHQRGLFVIKQTAFFSLPHSRPPIQTYEQKTFPIHKSETHKQYEGLRTQLRDMIMAGTSQEALNLLFQNEKKLMEDKKQHHATLSKMFIDTLDALLLTNANNDDIYKVYQLSQKIVQKLPPALTKDLIIKLASSEGKEKAFQIFKNTNEDPYSNNLLIYLVQGFTIEQVEGAVSFFRFLKDEKIRMQYQLLSRFLDLFASAGRFDAAEEVVQFMTGNNMRLDEDTYILLLFSYFKGNQPERGWDLYQRLQKQSPEIIGKAFLEKLAVRLTKNLLTKHAVRFLKQLPELNPLRSPTKWILNFMELSARTNPEAALALYRDCEEQGLPKDELIRIRERTVSTLLESQPEGVLDILCRMDPAVPTPSQDSLPRSSKPTPWTSLMRKFLSKNDIERAMQVWTGMRKHNVPMDERTCSYFLHHLRDHGFHDRANEFEQENEIILSQFMKEREADKNRAQSYATTFSNMISEGKRLEAYEWIVESVKNRTINQEGVILCMDYLFQKDAGDATDLFRNLINTEVIHSPGVLQAYFTNRFISQLVKTDFDLARSLVTYIEAQSHLVLLDKITFSILVTHLVKQQRYQDAMDIVASLDRRKLPFDISLINPVITGLAKQGDLKEALRVVAFIKSRSLKPNFISLSSILGVYTYNKEAENAWEFYSKEMKPLQMVPTIRVGTTFLALLFEAHRAKEALTFIEDVVKLNPDLDATFLNSAIRFLLLNKERDEALKYFNIMCSRKLPRFYSTYNNFIFNYSQQAPDFSTALSWYEKMKKDETLKRYQAVHPELHGIPRLFAQSFYAAPLAVSLQIGSEMKELWGFPLDSEAIGEPLIRFVARGTRSNVSITEMLSRIERGMKLDGPFYSRLINRLNELKLPHLVKEVINKAKESSIPLTNLPDMTVKTTPKATTADQEK